MLAKLTGRMIEAAIRPKPWLTFVFLEREISRPPQAPLAAGSDRRTASRSGLAEVKGFEGWIRLPTPADK